MGDFTKLAKKVVSVARGEDKKKPSPYDTKATVNRVDYENRKAYVRFYGGVDETPVDLTVNCERGDTVQVRVGGGRAWIVGNQTAPPTDDKAVNILKHTVNNLQTQMNDSVEKLEEEIEEIEPGEGKVIERIATEYILSELNHLVDDEVIPYEPTPGEPMEWSEELPEWVPRPRTYFWKRTVIYYTDGTVDEQDPILDANAQISAEADFAISSENNHFWHDTTGAYVTEQNKNAALGYASRVTNAGILQTYNGNLLTAWTGSGVSFYDGSGSTAATSKMLAAFYSSGITFDTTTPFTIGNTNSYIKWINTGTELSPNWKLQINADTIQFGGTDIEDATAKYTISTNVDSVTDTTTEFSPANLIVNFLKEGTAYDGRFIFKTSSNGSSWTTKYTSSSDEHYRSFALGAYYGVYSFFKIEMYEAGGTSNLLAEKTISVIADGEEGAQGPQGPAGEGAQYNQYMKWDSTNGLQFYAKAYNTDATTYSAMKNDGLHVYKDGNEVANFLSGSSTIGKLNSFYTYTDSSGLKFYYNRTELGGIYKDPYITSGISLKGSYNGYTSEVRFSPYYNRIQIGCNIDDSSDNLYFSVDNSLDKFEWFADSSRVAYLNTNGTFVCEGKINPVAISSDLFEVTSVSVSASGTTVNLEGSSSASNSKMYPLGVVGFNVSTSGSSSRGVYLSNKSTGSCTVNARAYNASKTTTSITVYVLWVRNTI